MQQAPWERYGGQAAPQGPWSRYAAPQQPVQQERPAPRPQPVQQAVPPPVIEPLQAEQAAPAGPMGFEESVGALLDQGYSPDDAERLAREQMAFDGVASPQRPAASGPAGTQQNPIDLTRPLMADEVPLLVQGAYVRGQNGEVYALPGDAFVQNPRASDESQGAGNVYIRRPNLSDSVEAFTQAAGEQIPFLDEAAAAASGAITGRGYEATREQQQLARMLQNQTDRGARVAGGLAGFAGTLFAPGVGAGGRFIQSGATNADKILRAGALGGLGGAVFGAGGAEGGLQDRGEAAALGALLGAGTGGALQGGVNRLSRPVQETAQRRLSRQGQELTLGQMLGGGAQRVEDALTSLPFAGDVIRDRQRDTLSSFDRLATNTALAPLGQALEDTAGREGVRAADEVISNAYRQALQGVSVDPADQVLQSSLQQVRNPQNLTANDAADLNATLDNILSRAQGVIDGDTWKRIDSDLAAAARSADAGAANRPSMSAVRDRLQEARTAWRDALGRVSPDALEGVSAADAAEAQYRLVRKASSDVASAGRGGDASPQTLNRAVVANASDRRVARGESLLQDLTDDAMQVLPRTVPDSGTPFRSLITSAGLGGGGVALGVDPLALGLAGALTGGVSALYSRPVQGLANRMYRASDRLGSTPDAELLSALLARSGQATAPLVPGEQNSRPQPRRGTQ